jgi:hypothetical protein
MQIMPEVPPTTSKLTSHFRIFLVESKEKRASAREGTRLKKHNLIGNAPGQ